MPLALFADIRTNIVRFISLLLAFHLLQNIELKVEVESLKKELQEKQELLDKAL